MLVSYRPLTDTVGAEILGVMVSDLLSDEIVAEIRRIWITHTVVVFRDQGDITPEQQVIFSRRFGPLAAHTFSDQTLPDEPAIAVVSNIRRNNRPFGAQKGGRSWHSDSQYLERPPSGSFLVGKLVPPEKGDTLFANMFSAFDALPEVTKHEINELKVVHSRVKTWPTQHPHRPPLTEEQMAKLPDRIHPLVRTHPECGRKSLFLGALMWEVVGMPTEQGRALLSSLLKFATQSRFIYTHKWRPGDAILWDNRSGLHCATPFEDDKHSRLMYRTQIEGDQPF